MRGVGCYYQLFIQVVALLEELREGICWLVGWDFSAVVAEDEIGGISSAILSLTKLIFIALHRQIFARAEVLDAGCVMRMEAFQGIDRSLTFPMVKVLRFESTFSIYVLGRVPEIVYNRGSVRIRCQDRVKLPSRKKFRNNQRCP